MLLLPLFFILLNFIVLFFVPSKFSSFLKIFSLIVSFLIFLSLIFFIFIFDQIFYGFQFCNHFFWNEQVNIFYSFGIDGLSILFLLLSSFLHILCLIYSWNSFNYCLKEYLFSLFFILFILLNFFMVLDFFFFFFFFEIILLPMFFIIGHLGSRQRRIHADFQFFLFTMFGSFFMLISLLLIYINTGISDLFILQNFSYNSILELFLWFFLFFSLSVKIPLFPLHLWLPEAHVEAPTIGSVVLAGVLLKMGSYGYLRFLIPVFPFANFYFNPFVFIFSFLSIFYIVVLSFCQIDLKKLIAYSSVSHMGFVTMGLFTFTFFGIHGSIFLMFSHGIVSSFLFFMVGILYDRYKTRIIFFYRSLFNYMPIFSGFFFTGFLANIGFPGTIGFVGEFLIMNSFFFVNKLAFFFLNFVFIFNVFYSFWLLNRVFSLSYLSLFKFSDLTKREFLSIFPLFVLIFVFGIFPNLVLNFLDFYVYSICVFFGF